MWLLYVDGSGTVGQDTHVVLGGVAVFEGEIYKLTRHLEDTSRRLFPELRPAPELHVRDVKSRCFASQPHNVELLNCFLDAMAYAVSNVSLHGLVLFGSVVHVPTLDEGVSPYLSAYEDICSRFNSYLITKHKSGDTQKGIVILDECAERKHILVAHADVKAHGNRWGHSLNNLPEAPMFVDSETCRLVQLADYVAHALYRRYERGDARDFDKVINRFHWSDGVVHGLGHIIDHREDCKCTACVTRLARSQSAPASDTECPEDSYD